MWCKIQRILSWLLLVGAFILLVSILSGVVAVPTAAASIRQMEEAPGQILLQSRHQLQDARDNTWQVILFKRSQADGTEQVNLRLVGFPGSTALIHPQALKVVSAAGATFTASDAFADQAPADNVGQYDFKTILEQLPVAATTLSLVMRHNQRLQLSVPPEVILEWKAISPN